MAGRKVRLPVEGSMQGNLAEIAMLYASHCIAQK